MRGKEPAICEGTKSVAKMHHCLQGGGLFCKPAPEESEHRAGLVARIPVPPCLSIQAEVAPVDSLATEMAPNSWQCSPVPQIPVQICTSQTFQSGIGEAAPRPGSRHSHALHRPGRWVLGLNGGCKRTLSILVLDGPPLVAMHAFSA